MLTKLLSIFFKKNSESIVEEEQNTVFDAEQIIEPETEQTIVAKKIEHSRMRHLGY